MNFLKSMYNAFFKDNNNNTAPAAAVGAAVHRRHENAILIIWYPYEVSLFTIYSHLEQCGNIINTWKLPRLGNAIFEFSSSQEAKIARQKAVIKIEKRVIYIFNCFEDMFEEYCSTEVDRIVEIDSILLRPPNEKSPKNILNVLNDDCLHEIFKRIHLADRYSFANVCIRFNRILMQLLATEHKMFQISGIQSLSISQADDYLRYFGSSIYQAEIEGKNVKLANTCKIYIIIKMMSEYCINLCVFRISNVLIDKQTGQQLIPLFKRIEKLYIQRTADFGPDSACKPFVFLPSINCPKLVTLEWNNEFWKWKPADVPALQKFLIHNKQLKSFLYCGNENHARFSKKYYLPVNIFLFGQLKCLRNLTIINWESTELYGVNVDIERAKLKNLLNLSYLVEQLLIENVPIEYLKLVNIIIDDTTIEHISQMKTIKKFAFVDFNYYTLISPIRDVTASYLNRLESSLPNLEFLQFQTSTCIDIIFTDEHVNSIEKQIQKKIPNITLDMHKFNSNKDIFIDQYNLTTIQNTFRLWFRQYACGRTQDFTLIVRKCPVDDLNVRHYWLTLSTENEGSHSKTSIVPSFPVFDIPF